MAVFSMTGFASTQMHCLAVRTPTPEELVPEKIVLGMDIKSVNSRFLDLTFKLPDDFRAFEPQLRDVLQKNLKRGKIELRAWWQANPQAGTGVFSDTALQSLEVRQAQLMDRFPSALPLRVVDLMRLAEPTQTHPTVALQDLVQLLEQALQALKESRSQEGARLSYMLTGHCTQLHALADRAAPLAEQAVLQHQERFAERYRDALDALGAVLGGTLNQQAGLERGLAEAAAFAMRIDTAEEVTRIHSHLDEIHALLQKGGELGKRLDFLIQELHREANTLGAKAQSLPLTRVSVEMKVLIEQMREQVQNIE